MLMNKTTTLLLALLTLGAPQIPLQAQTKQDEVHTNLIPVKVTIVDEAGEVLPGVSVRIQGTNRGAFSSLKGEVSLSVAQGDTLIISFVGMKTKTLVVTKPLVGKITLQSETGTLDQVVITGYTRTSTRRSAGSVSTISSKELLSQPLTGVDGLLQGKLAGVSVRTLSGRPGSSSEIVIRGVNSLSASISPLWVVDGVPLQRDIPKIDQARFLSKDFRDIFSDGIAGINPNDIESVTILKDAAAAAIYGSRAAGGVIVVTTKRGKAGQLTVNYSTNLALVDRPSRTYDLMTSREKLAWEQELWDEFSAPRKAQGLTYPVLGAVGQIRSGFGKYAGWTTAQQDAEIARLGEHSTDWFKELFRPSFSHSHYLSLSGGSEKSRYYVSLGYLDNKGLLQGDGYNRYNLNSKLDLSPSKRVQIGLNLDLSLQDAKAPSAYIDPYSYAYFANPYERPGINDETYRSILRANGQPDPEYPTLGFDMLRELRDTYNKVRNLTATTTANLTVKLRDDLNLTGMASFGYVGNNSENFNGSNTYSAWLDRRFADSGTNRTYGSLALSEASNTNYNLRAQINWSPRFGDAHSLQALAGAELRGLTAKSTFAKLYGYDPETGSYTTPIYPEGTKIDYARLQAYANDRDQLAGRGITQEAFASFYFSSTYSYHSKYIASLTARIDGSSNFGSKEQFNPTGSLGLGWNVDRETFFESLRPVLSSLTVRTAIGYTGNINKSVYPQLIINYRNSQRVADDAYYRMGYIKDTPNPHLRWEKTRDAKIAIEAGFLKERFRLTAELYDRYTTDAVSSALVPRTTGFAYQTYNTSTLRNQGIELQLYGRLLKLHDWTLTAMANVAYNHNVLLRYDPPVSGLSTGLQEGYPLGALFTGRPQGIDPILGIYRYEARPDARMDNVADRALSDHYLYYAGLRRAPWTGGYSFTLGYKAFSLSLAGSYSIGGKSMDDLNYPVTYSTLGKRVVERIPSIENDLYIHHLNGRRDVRDRWTESNPRTDAHPRIIDAYGDYLGLTNYSTNSELITRSSRLQSVSFLRLGSMTLNYSLPSDWLRKTLHVNSLSASFSMTNLFVLSSYRGLDPETPGAIYPQPRTYSLGLSVGL